MDGWMDGEDLILVFVDRSFCDVVIFESRRGAPDLRWVAREFHTVCPTNRPSSMILDN